MDHNCVRCVPIRTIEGRIIMSIRRSILAELRLGLHLDDELFTIGAIKSYLNEIKPTKIFLKLSYRPKLKLSHLIHLMQKFIVVKEGHVF